MNAFVVIRLAVLLGVCLLSATGARCADEKVLEPQDHRETWYSRRGGLLKDVSWTFTPKIRREPGTITIWAGMEAKRLVDNFAGVAGEISFTDIDDAPRKAYLTLADGREVEAPGFVWNFAAAGGGPPPPVVKLRLECRVLERTWSLEWELERRLGPDEQVLEFIDPASGRKIEAAPAEAAVALRLVVSKENPLAGRTLVLGEIEAATPGAATSWLLEPAGDEVFVRSFVSAPRILAPPPQGGEGDAMEEGAGDRIAVGEDGRLEARVETARAELLLEQPPAEVVWIRFLARDERGAERPTRMLPEPPGKFRVELRFSGKPAASQRTLSLYALPPEAAALVEQDPDLQLEEDVVPTRRVRLLPDPEGVFVSEALQVGMAGGLDGGAEGVVPLEEGKGCIVAASGRSLAVAATASEERLKVVLEVDRPEARPSDPEPPSLLAAIRSASEGAPEPEAPVEGTILFTVKTGDAEPVRAAFPLEGSAAGLTFRWSAEEQLWLADDAYGERALELEPGIYTFEAEVTPARAGLRPPAKGSVKLTLHAPPKLVVYAPGPDASGKSLEQVPQLEHVVHDQAFRIGVIESPFLSGSQPDKVAVTLRSSVESITVEVPRIEGGGDGLPVYDMRGDSVVTYNKDRLDKFPELVTHPFGEDIVLSYGGVSRTLRVSRDRYAREAREIEEVLKDYQAMFAALGSLQLEDALRREVQAKSDLLTRALALHQLHEKVPLLPLIEISAGYLELVQQRPEDWGGGGLRYAPEDFLAGAPLVPYAWDAEWGMLQTRKHVGYGRTLSGSYDALNAAFVSAATLPYNVVKAAPEILASPVYSGYTLCSGRRLDGEWASGQEKLMAGAEVALTLVPLSASVLKTARPDLYQRALRRLRWAEAPAATRILPDASLSGPRWPEFAEKIAKAEKTIAGHEAGIARLRQTLAGLPERARAAEAAAADLRSQLARFEAEAPAAKRMEGNRRKLREREAKYRALEAPTADQTAAYRAEMRDLMTKLDKDRRILVEQQAGLAKDSATAEAALRKVAAEQAAAEGRIAQLSGHIADRRAEIERWRHRTARGQAPAAARARSAASKAQGNAGELIAFEALSRDGFIRHVERGGRMPNRMQSWREVGACLQVFEKTPDELALRIGLDPDELRMLLVAEEAADPGLLEKARAAFSEWGAQGVPYWPTGSIGPDGIYWNPRTHRLRIVEVKTGAAELGATQLTNRGIETWIARMRGEGNLMYRPNLAEGLTQALRSGELERCVIRVNGREIVELYLVEEVNGTLVRKAVTGAR